MAEHQPAPSPFDAPAEAPVEPIYTHAASPFIQTEAPLPVAFTSPPATPPRVLVSTYQTYRTQIHFGLAILAYLMMVVGVGTVLGANPAVAWRYYVAALPVVPAGLVLWLFVRALGRLDEVQKRLQLQAFGFAIGATALLTFGYGFLEDVGLPHLNWTLILPLMSMLWGVGAAIVALKHRLRR